MTSLLDIGVGKRRKWIVLAAWIALLPIAGIFAGKLFDSTDDGRLTYLPRGAEATRVVELQQQLGTAETFPAVIVYHRYGGLTDADRDRARNDLARLGAPVEVVEAEDEQALLATLPIDAGGARNSGEVVIDRVEELRAELGAGEGGLEIRVTGPAGAFADEVAVFDGIDTTLLVIPAIVVALLLLLIYRSPLLWLVPLLCVLVAVQAANALVYGLSSTGWVPVSSLAAGVLAVLVYGAATDYALLLVARYREQLRAHADRHDAMAAALRSAAPAILASGSTVALGLLALLAADVNSMRGLGPVGAIGILCALGAMLTLLPALLLALGRWIFWPAIPRPGDAAAPATRNVWARLADAVRSRPRAIWATTTAALAAASLGLFAADDLRPESFFRDEPDSIAGYRLIAEHFPASADAPVQVVAPVAARGEVGSILAAVAGVADVERAAQSDSHVQLDVQLAVPAGSEAEREAVATIRERLDGAGDGNALVGGEAAIAADVDAANSRDRWVVMPLVLLVVGAIIALLLRALVAPVALVAATLLSYLGALGLSVLAFDHLFGFDGLASSVPLFAFVFLVALGVDYSIFLVSRAHEEAPRLGTRAAILHSLRVTGGVITSAGIVLAATFSVLTLLPLVEMVQLGFVVAVGILIDTFVVRTLVVPALGLELGARLWWPSSLSPRDRAEHAGREAPSDPRLAPVGGVAPLVATGRSAGVPAGEARELIDEERSGS